jgi:hypothetical protein
LDAGTEAYLGLLGELNHGEKMWEDEGILEEE